VKREGYFDAVFVRLGSKHYQTVGPAREIETPDTLRVHPGVQYCTDVHGVETHYMN
jgi:hypothetical protein